MGSIEIVNAAEKRVPQPDLPQSPVSTSCQTKPKNLFKTIHVRSLSFCNLLKHFLYLTVSNFLLLPDLSSLLRGEKSFM